MKIERRYLDIESNSYSNNDYYAVENNKDSFLFMRGNFNLLENIPALVEEFSTTSDYIYIDSVLMSGVDNWKIYKVDVKTYEMTEIDSPKFLNKGELDVVRYFYFNVEEDFTCLTSYQKKKAIERYESAKRYLQATLEKKAL